MAEGKYCVELAKSGRSSCKRCKSAIQKDSIRIGTKGMMGEHETVSWTHAHCFKPSRGISFQEFLANLSGFHDLDATKQSEIHNLVQSNMSDAGSKRAHSGESEIANEKSPKSAKKTKENKDASLVETGASDDTYEHYKKMSIDALKDVLRMNNQILKGTKPELVKKCVDGHKHGALPPCPELGCGGRLSPDYELGIVTCSGKYSEERGSYMKCYFKAKLSGIAESSRIPWRTTPMSEEEKGQSTSSSSQTGLKIKDEHIDHLFDDIDITSTSGRKSAITKLVDESRKLGIELPVNDSEAAVKVASIMLSESSTATPSTILQALALEYGTKTASQNKLSDSTLGLACPENGPIIIALGDLVQKHIKNGNMEAAGVYRKAIASIRNLEYQIVDGKALTRAKTKVQGIGKKIATLIDLFLTTGSMETTTAEDEYDDE